MLAIFFAAQTDRRRQMWLLAAVGYVAVMTASVIDPRAENFGLLHWSLVAGWLAVVLAVSEVVRTRREQGAERARAAEEEQRRLSDRRPGLAHDLHDVLARYISLINVQASAAMYLLDEQSDRARPALTAIKDASNDALQEVRAALDTLRFGAEAPRASAPRLLELACCSRVSGREGPTCAWS